VTFRGGFADSAVKVKPIGWTEDVSLEPIAGSKLMHGKYVLRDGHTEHGAVLMGSANFTDDAWTRQDNNVMVLHSPALCAFYETDFNELWASGKIAGTGVNDFGPLNRDGLEGEIAFSPGDAGVHDFMHNKLVVADDTTLTGSHNFSLSAQQNAKNAILLRDAELAQQYRSYVETLVKKYGS
jgi:phosphatidylserine/phosphatidylglycerophosphate/cardiolipin synthase-like enzyme